MADEYDKLDPDELLKAIQTEEKRTLSGQLKVFFGMSAGVGKTYAMLEEAQRRLKEGVDLVVGTINTHGREDTERLLKGLTIVPEKWITYKDTVFEEMDMKAILDLKPQLVLVDELAHTNVPGSKHLKRWQDVIDLLDAGIDVYTTLNVQHIESRKDLVESLTGIEMHETVPDLILERASSIELIDLPPPELLQRLREGKVYLGEQSKVAAEHFFQEENLMALREIALRLTAEKVDHDLHARLQKKGWKTRERIMVAVSPTPSSEQIIRSARRVSFELDAPWIAVYVDTGAKLDDDAQARLNRHLNLARNLGAEVVVTHDLDVANALQRVAKQKDVTRLIVGRSKRRRSFWELFQGSFVDKLERENKNLDITILRQEKISSVYQRSLPLKSGLMASGYQLASGVVAAITAISFVLTPLIGYKPVGFIFLLGILALSFFVSRGPILFAALLSAVCWEFFFMAPFFHPAVSDPENLIFVVVYFVVAAIMGTMMSRIQQQDQFLHEREENTGRLLDFELESSKSNNLQDLRINVCSRLEGYFPGKFDVLVEGPDHQLISDGRLLILNTDREKAAAIWVFQNGKVGGWSTDTLPSAKGIYFPIQFSREMVGVLAYLPNRERPLSLEEMNFLRAVTQQLAVTLKKHLNDGK